MLLTFTRSPLPFQGQKRNLINSFASLISTVPKGFIFVDLFGGSGLLSRACKDLHPDSEVVYNDYDEFSERLKNIDSTNALIGRIDSLISKYDHKKRISDKDYGIINDIIKEHEENYKYIDYTTLSSYLLFSGNYAKNYDELIRNRYWSNSYKQYSADGYLNGLSITRLDYNCLFDNYKDKENVIYIADPPYLGTQKESYNMNYWRLKNYIDVLYRLKDKKFIYFTSSKSEIVDLIESLGKFGVTCFDDIEISSTKNTVAHNADYQDYMLHNIGSIQTSKQMELII